MYNVKYFIIENGKFYYVVTTLGNILTTTGYKCMDLKQTELPTGYMQVTIMKNKKGKSHLVHRLVAKAFLPNPENKPCVNHIDGNKKNNSVTNLEWCTYSENEKHSYSVLGKVNSRSGTGKFGKLNGMSKPVISIKDGIEQYFESISLAAKELKVFNSNIAKVLSGKYKHTGGYTFKYC
jgi:hypothetical protein